jgi:hypothetical protein
VVDEEALEAAGVDVLALLPDSPLFSEVDGLAAGLSASIPFLRASEG